MQQNSETVMTFSKAFNPTNQEHVMWLKKVQEAVANLDTTKCQLPAVIDQNPMKVKFQASDLINWVHVHFTLTYKYSKSVLEGEAWIPPQKKN